MLNDAGFYLKLLNSPVPGDMEGKWVVVIEGPHMGHRGTIIKDDVPTATVLFNDGTTGLVNITNMYILSVLPETDGPVGTDPEYRAKLASPCKPCLHGHNISEEMDPCCRCVRAGNGEKDFFFPLV
jgi:hypothetical protein